MLYNIGDSERLNEEGKDLSRVRQSLVEELQAINWYDERIQNSDDDSVIKILTHNRDEEKEHAAMLINWLRKNDKFFDRKFNEDYQS